MAGINLCILSSFDVETRTDSMVSAGGLEESAPIRARQY